MTSFSFKTEVSLQLVCVSMRTIKIQYDASIAGQFYAIFKLINKVCFVSQGGKSCAKARSAFAEKFRLGQKF